MSRPTPSQMHVAAEWLIEYEATTDDDQTRTDMLAVAAWLREQADGADLRAAAKAHGVSVARVRAALRARAKIVQPETV